MSDGLAHHRRLAFGEFVIDCDRGSLSRHGVDIRLRPKSFAVLCHLAANAGRLVSKADLMQAVWGRTVVTDGSLTQCIIDVRRALGPDGPRMLRTVPRRGFIFEPPSITSGDDLQGLDGQHAAPPTPVHTAAPTRTARRPFTVTHAVLALLLVVAAGWLLQSFGRGPDGAQEALAPGTGSPRETPDQKSIAVLRFLDLSPDADQAYFADGLGEEILHLLSQSAELRVTARSSSFAFDPASVDFTAIADRLEVAYLLEGSVRRADDQLRVTVQLIDTADQSHVWSRTYDRPFEQLLAVQRDIATDVARALKVTLRGGPSVSSPAAALAQNLFLLGRHLFHRRAPGDLEAAVRYLEQAVAIDPEHARAWTALAGALAARGGDELDDPDYRLEERTRALEQALRLDPELPEAYVRSARLRRSAGDLDGARVAWNRALALAPNDPLVLIDQANAARLEGDPVAALELEQRAIQVDPLSAVYRSNFGRALLAAGRLEAALEEFHRARDLSPGIDVEFDMVRALLLMGRPDDAHRERRAVDDPLRVHQLAALLDHPPDSRLALERLRSFESPLAHLLLAEIAAFRDDPEAAFEHLDSAVSLVQDGQTVGIHCKFVFELLSSPFLNRIQDDPRWRMLLSTVRSG